MAVESFEKQRYFHSQQKPLDSSSLGRKFVKYENATAKFNVIVLD